VIMNIHERIRALRERQTRREAGAQSLGASQLGGSLAAEQSSGEATMLRTQ
jgi:hypothetical protein